MSRDRLAELRAQQGSARDDYGNSSQPPRYPPTSRPYQSSNQRQPETTQPWSAANVGLPSGPGRNQAPQRGRGGEENPYSRPAPPRQQSNPFDDRGYQSSDSLPLPSNRSANSRPMNSYNNSTTTLLKNNGVGDDMDSFFAEIGEVRNLLAQYSAAITQLSSLQSRSLTSVNSSGGADEEISQALDDSTASTRSLSNQLKSRVGELNRAASRGFSKSDIDLKRSQYNLIKRKFEEEVQRWMGAERDYRQKCRNRVERQVRIVKPNATDDEVRAAVEGDGGAIFSQALMSSNRMGQSRAALNEVQSRHEEIKKIEQTMTEIAQLFNDLALMVEEQGEVIVQIEQQTEVVEKDVQSGQKELVKAVVAARGARKKRWICLAIVVVAVIIIGIVIAVEVAGKGGGSTSNSSSAPSASATAKAASATPSASVVARSG